MAYSLVILDFTLEWACAPDGEPLWNIWSVHMIDLTMKT